MCLTCNLCDIVPVCVYLLTELYSYTESPEFQLNRKCFEEDFRLHGKSIVLSFYFKNAFLSGRLVKAGVFVPFSSVVRSFYLGWL